MDPKILDFKKNMHMFAFQKKTYDGFGDYILVSIFLCGGGGFWDCKISR